MAAEVYDVIEVFDASQLPICVRALIMHALGQHGRACMHEVEPEPIPHKPFLIFVDKEPKRRPEKDEPAILAQILQILADHNILITQYLSTTIGVVTKPVEVKEAI